MLETKRPSLASLANTTGFKDDCENTISSTDHRAKIVHIQKFSLSFRNNFSIHKKRIQKPTKMMQVYRQRKRRRGAVPRGGPVKYSKVSGGARGFVRQSGFYGRYAGAGRKRYAKSETKFFDTQFIVGGLNASPRGIIVLDSMNLVPQGVLEDNRIGRKMCIKSIQVKLQIEKEESKVSPENDVFRFMVVLDKQANGAAATAPDVLDSNSFFSFFNLENSSRFLILYDKHMVLRTNGAADSATGVWGGQTKWLQISKRVNIPIEFGGVTGALAEVRSNNIFLLAAQQDQPIGASPILGNGRCRIRFSDN